MDPEISSSSNAYQLPKSAERSCGRWTQEEHRLFVMGLARYGKNWKKIEQLIQTRTGSQIRSHAQKYFNKLAKQVDKPHPLHWEAQTSVPNYQDEPRLRLSHQENENSTLPHSPKTNSYLLEKIPAGQSYCLNSYDQPLFRVPVEAKDHSFSSFFEHLFRSPLQVLNSDFYELYVDHCKPCSEESQPEAKQQPPECKKRISFTQFQPQESYKGAGMDEGQPVMRVVEAGV